jgi:hypothetical protein
VTRTIIASIMENAGKGISEAVIQCICRLGGWQALTGVRTLLRVYAHKIIDTFCDSMSLQAGRRLGPRVWEERWQLYAGNHHHVPVRTYSWVFELKLPLGVKVAEWCTSGWRVEQEECNRVALQALSCAERDGRLMPVRRWQEYGTAVREFIRMQQGNVATAYARLLQPRERIRRLEVLPKPLLESMLRRVYSADESRKQSQNGGGGT